MIVWCNIIRRRSKFHVQSSTSINSHILLKEKFFEKRKVLWSFNQMMILSNVRASTMHNFQHEIVSDCPMIKFEEIFSPLFILFTKSHIFE